MAFEIWFVLSLVLITGIGFWLGRLSRDEEVDHLSTRIKRLTDRDERGRFKK